MLRRMAVALDDSPCRIARLSLIAIEQPIERLGQVRDAAPVRVAAPGKRGEMIVRHAVSAEQVDRGREAMDAALTENGMRSQKLGVRHCHRDRETRCETC